MIESKFQAEVICDISKRLPEAIVLKNDSTYIQGIPDLTVLCNGKWAMLECKKSKDEHHQPNQDYYIDWANKMSFGRFIFPENKEEVLNELQQALGHSR